VQVYRYVYRYMGREIHGDVCMDKNLYSDALKQMEAYLVDGLEFKAGGVGGRGGRDAETWAIGGVEV